MGTISLSSHGLMALSRIDCLDDFSYTTLMAFSEVDQKFLGLFAKNTGTDNPFLSSMLFKVLGLSVILSKKLLRARRLRKLDTTRDTKSLQLYHHIIWLSREGQVIIENYILPMVAVYIELKVLAYKLRGSFYHIYVLFHNQPSVHLAATSSSSPSTAKGKGVDRSSMMPSPTELEGGPVRNPTSLPPELVPVSVPKPSASFLLPAIDYIPIATSCFTVAASLADELLSGSHPLRLSVKVEYAAYMYDCLHDAEGSRNLAQKGIRDVYNAQEGMDDEMFEDAAELVGILGKMMKRGLGSSGSQGTASGRGSVRTSSTPRLRPIHESPPPPSTNSPPSRNSPRRRR